jgi:hypothetical protein
VTPMWACPSSSLITTSSTPCSRRRVAGGVEAAGAALTGGAELVEPGADVRDGDLCEFFPSGAGDEVEPGGGGVAACSVRQVRRASRSARRVVD